MGDSFDGHPTSFDSRHFKQIPVHHMTHEPHRSMSGLRGSGFPNSVHSVFGSNKQHLDESSGFRSNHNEQPSQQQPKIVNIPIRIEGRDSPLSGSPNNMSHMDRAESPAMHGPQSMPSRLSSPVGSGDRITPSPTGPNIPTPPPKPTVISFSGNPAPQLETATPAGSKVHEIPLHIEGSPEFNVQRNRAPSWDSSRYLKKCTPLPGQTFGTPRAGTPQRPQSTEPHVTRIPVNNLKTSNRGQQSQQKPAEGPRQQSTPPPDPLQIIQNIQQEISRLKSQVDEFTGEYQDKQYRYLDEMFTRCMIKLDNVESAGRDDVRQTRRAALNEIERCLAALEKKVKPSQSLEKPKQVIEDKVEIDEEQNIPKEESSMESEQVKAEASNSSGLSARPLEDQSTKGEVQETDQLEIKGSNSDGSKDHDAHHEPMDCENTSHKDEVTKSENLSPSKEDQEDAKNESG